MSSFIRKIWLIFVHKQTSLGTAAAVLMAMVIGSGLLGLIRLRVLYSQFTPEETGVFFAAFRIPNLLFELLAMGTLTTAFIPVFTKYITKGESEIAHTMASTVINVTVLILIVLSVPICIWTPAISRLFAPGFTSSQIDQMAIYTRIMVILQVIPLIIGNFFTGILQSYNLFLIPALAPVLYNAGIILGILIFSEQFGLYAAVIGVGIGAFLFMAIQIPVIIHTGYRHRWEVNIRRQGVNEIVRLMIPRMIGLGASQIDVTVDLILSSLLGSKMVTVFFLAQSLQQLPVRLFGTTISQAVLPMLSSAAARQDLEKFKHALMASYNMMLFLILPTSVAFIVLRTPFVRLVFGAERFDWEATVLTAMTLSAFSFSLFAQAISQVFIRGFYALYDSKTPVTISIITIAINSVLSIVGIILFHFPVWFLGISTSIASIINAGMLLIMLHKRTGGFAVSEVLYKPVKMVIVSFISGLIMFISMKLFDQLVFDTTRVWGLVMLTGFTGCLGLICYLFLSWVMDISEIWSIVRLMDKIKHLRGIIIEPAREIISGETSGN